MIGRLRGTPLATATVGVHSPGRAAVAITAAEGRWPTRQVADRIALAIGAAGMAAGPMQPDRWSAFQSTLVDAAGGIVRAGDGDLDADLVRLDGFAGAGILRIGGDPAGAEVTVGFELVSAMGNQAVVRLDRTSRNASPSAAAVACLAQVLALAEPSDADDRLALALAIEGLVAWYRESDRRAAPRMGLQFALVHAADRLRSAGRTVPPGLTEPRGRLG